MRGGGIWQTQIFFFGNGMDVASFLRNVLQLTD